MMHQFKIILFYTNLCNVKFILNLNTISSLQCKNTAKDNDLCMYICVYVYVCVCIQM
jgi:hypothetical protein